MSTVLTPMYRVSDTPNEFLHDQSRFVTATVVSSPNSSKGLQISLDEDFSIQTVGSGTNQLDVAYNVILPYAPPSYVDPSLLQQGAIVLCERIGTRVHIVAVRNWGNARAQQSAPPVRYPNQGSMNADLQPPGTLGFNLQTNTLWVSVSDNATPPTYSWKQLAFA